MKPSVDLLFDPNQDFYHASSIYAGLDLLSRRGDIALRFRRAGAAERMLVEDSLVVPLVITRGTGGTQNRVVIDLRDRSDVVAMGALEHCDAYFKRSYRQADIERLTPDHWIKVKPFGLNYACRTAGSLFRLICQTARAWINGTRVAPGRLRHQMLLPTVGEFEQQASRVLEPSVVFQTRVWEAHETGTGDSETINEWRVGMIRALREAFGPAFRGGLVRTPLALARYPNEISPHPTRRSQYTKMSKQNLIGVYTQGLHDSSAFKLAEYLAASQCVVAEPPRHLLPEPLMPGTHFEPFRTPNECVAACERLLADASRAEAMRRANHAYYDQFVEPSARVRRVIDWAR